MTGIGPTLRARREQRGETLTECAERTGLDASVLAALEEDRIADAGDGVEAAVQAARRYAMHLELDAHRLADEVRAQQSDDPDADTQPIPIVAVLRKAKEPAVIWLAAGGVLGVALVAVLGGGLGFGGGGDAATPTTSGAAQGTAAAAGPEGQAAAPTLTPAAPRPAIDLRLGARAGKTVWVEVRRGGVSGDQLFAGIVGAGVTRRVTSRSPIWLGVAWAPNVKLTLNGEPLDAQGGTESYLVTARGLKRLGTG